MRILLAGSGFGPLLGPLDAALRTDGHQTTTYVGFPADPEEAALLVPALLWPTAVYSSRHVGTPLCVSLGILCRKYTGARDNDFTAGC
jgi:hypothetical protein